MDSQEVGALLEECLRAAGELQPGNQPSETHRLQYCSCTDALCAELSSLLQDAADMKWPFVPEKWQYKRSVGAADKTNLSDLIAKHLPHLLAVLKSSILAREARSALAVVFLVDRFLYWTDESSRLLKIAKLLHKRHPDAPVAPQLVIRQARVYLNSGKLQKAEYILSSLINNRGTTGCWLYRSEGDKTLVQAVSVQVRGMILQKLGLWREAAELVWASLVGYFSLPQPDKKGIGTSLGILANILVSMNDEDFRAFSTNPNIDLSLLGDGRHRLLSAAQAAKMAVVYSQYTSLYVLTNVVTQGTCLLSYSFSAGCPASRRNAFLRRAQEAFAVGLLTKAECDVVTSQQELHSLLKAAYSLTVARKWLGDPPHVVDEASRACQEAIAKFYTYRHAATQERTGLSTEIMHQLTRVKVLLRVEPFPNSDQASFIPDAYRNVGDVSVKFTPEAFAIVMGGFQKYHETLSETSGARCRGAVGEADRSKLCMTALWTADDPLKTECSAEPCVAKGSQAGETPESGPSPQSLCPTLGSSDDLSSSWQKLSFGGSGSPRPNGSGFLGTGVVRQEVNVCDQCPTTESDDWESGSRPPPTDKNKGLSSQAATNSSDRTSLSSSGHNGSDKLDVKEADIETEDLEEDWMNDLALKQKVDREQVLSLSQLTLATTSSSLGDSLGSQSSWEKVPYGLSVSPPGKRQPQSTSKAGISQRSGSQDSDGSFTLLNATEDRIPERDAMSENVHVDPNMETEVDPEPLKDLVPERPAVTETSTESSFEMVEEVHGGQKHDGVKETANAPREKNPLCSSCPDGDKFAAVRPGRQFLLSRQDYQALLAGVCHQCLLERLHSDETKFKLETHMTAKNGLHLKFSKTTGLWTARETCVYIGEDMKKAGSQRRAVWLQFLHQEERLSSYVGKDYLEPKGIQLHLKDVERQMTAQHYVTEFNKSLYEKEVMAQIFFIPSEALLILDANEIVGCVTVEPYMLGDFVKLTNNTWKTNLSIEATEYGLAFGHFTYLFSKGQEVVVDLQGWVAADGKGLTYLTDPQIHSTKLPKSHTVNMAEGGIRCFVEKQHGPQCNRICQLLRLPPMGTWPNVCPQET